MAFILTTHFYNEEWILPYWLEHVTKIFDHAVLVNYASTDNSVDIIREMAPGWEIVNSVNAVFDAELCDKEIMAHERRFMGDWKMCLNVTEFPIHENLKGLIEQRQQEDPQILGFRLMGAEMVDPSYMQDVLVDPDVPLVAQRYWGIMSEKNPRCRIIHKAPDGMYLAGRHLSHLPLHNPREGAYLLWYGWSPMKHVRERKLQIRSRIPKSDFDKGYGIEHNVDAGLLQWTYQTMWEPRTYNLLEDDRYKDTLGKVLKDLYNIENDWVSDSRI
jgi:Glycosyl transferase family 2